MTDKVCTNCKWFREGLFRDCGYCVRFPKWVYIDGAFYHQCGEFKEREKL